MTPAEFWASLPADDRDRFGLLLSRLVLRAARPLGPDREELE